MSIAFVVFYGSLNAARRIFRRLLDSVVGTNTNWHARTPLGRILARFSEDSKRNLPLLFLGLMKRHLVGEMDGSTAFSFKAFLSLLAVIVSASLVVSALLPAFLIFLVFLFAISYYLSRSYVYASRAIRRMRQKAIAPLYSGFGETLQGSLVRCQRQPSFH